MSKVSRRKEITKIRVEINETEAKKIVGKKKSVKPRTAFFFFK